MDVYLEVGKKRVFAGAPAWPGWCRSGKTEEAALEALLRYGARYAEILRGASIRPAFAAPRRMTALHVIERLDGDATTEFGAPSIAPSVDEALPRPADLARLTVILQASWAALDRAADRAAGVDLSKGPRGGGRDLPSILEHVEDAERSYARRIAARIPSSAGLRDARDAVLDGLASAAADGVPAQGPRGGRMWSPGYFVRRSAWHVLDHAWEIEDRSV